MRVTVRSALSECDLEAPPKTQARDFFNMMTRNFVVGEPWFFGLFYYGNNNNEEIWIDSSKKSLKDFRGVAQKFYYAIKYHPEDVVEELFDKTTIELFFAQLKSQIYKDEIFCPPDTCALLASYALQAKHGDYVENGNDKSILDKQKLIPDRIIKQHKMDIADWEKSIKNMWKKHNNLDPEEAMIEYLKLVQNLEMYGVTYFDIKNKKGSNLLLGVNALGLDVYNPEDKLNPQISFPWSEIKNLKFKDRKFTIKTVDKVSLDFLFFTNEPRISKTILNLGVGNHLLYVRRRKPDGPEMAELKKKAQQIKAARKAAREQLMHERAAREEIEKREQNYLDEIKAMKEEMERNRASLLEAQNTIEKLQKQLEELQKAKQELELQQNELKAMMERFEESKHLEEEEKRRLEEEIREKQREVQRIQREVEEKDAETRRLQEEVELAKIREQQAVEIARLEEERKRREQEEKENQELEQLPEGADTTLPEVNTVDVNLQDEIKLLQEKLNDTRDEDLETDLDKIHRSNLALGRNKYKTLADIRRGNTLRRVELFENM